MIIGATKIVIKTYLRFITSKIILKFRVLKFSLYFFGLITNLYLNNSD